MCTVATLCWSLNNYYHNCQIFLSCLHIVRFQPIYVQYSVYSFPVTIIITIIAPPSPSPGCSGLLLPQCCPQSAWTSCTLHQCHWEQGTGYSRPLPGTGVSACTVYLLCATVGLYRVPGWVHVQCTCSSSCYYMYIAVIYFGPKLSIFWGKAWAIYFGPKLWAISGRFFWIRPVLVASFKGP